MTTPQGVKERQQKTWASGDYSVIANMVAPLADSLCEFVDVRAGDDLLDVATGSGNTALAAARRFCNVTGADYVPELLDRARERAACERLSIEFREGDSENLPFGDGSFDVVLSTVGAMFSPDPERTAAELLRVCRSGGKIGLASWTPSGFIGQLFKTTAGHVAPPPGVPSPLAWGTESRLQELFGSEAISIETRLRHCTFRAPAPEYWVDWMKTYYGPTLKAFEAVGEAGRAALHADLVDLAKSWNRSGDATLVIDSEYLEAVIVKR